MKLESSSAYSNSAYNVVQLEQHVRKFTQSNYNLVPRNSQAIGDTGGFRVEV